MVIYRSRANQQFTLLSVIYASDRGTVTNSNSVAHSIRKGEFIAFSLLCS